MESGIALPKNTVSFILAVFLILLNSFQKWDLYISERELGFKTVLLSMISHISTASHWEIVSRYAALLIHFFIGNKCLWHHVRS